MTRNLQEFTVEKLPGEKFASIEAAQLAAREDLAMDLTNTIRELIASGKLVEVAGKIIPNTDG